MSFFRLNRIPFIIFLLLGPVSVISYYILESPVVKYIPHDIPITYIPIMAMAAPFYIFGMTILGMLNVVFRELPQILQGIHLTGYLFYLVGFCIYLILVFLICKIINIFFRKKV